MKELVFQPASAVPLSAGRRQSFLVIHPSDGYCLGRAFFDELNEFVCFLIDEEFGETAEALHQGQYLAWASLPSERIILESL
ncbi:hypothetical protein [Serratia ureilytica]|uniref:hypothetical protein n=1 Tax=Serratia ureilytica TaxID=300181 RepID=UPI0018D9B7D0|nr:hypothetical protein [Serratia ureilytica]MBH2557182.1 hypothetical protein [Serratia ureilytica]